MDSRRVRFRPGRKRGHGEVPMLCALLASPIVGGEGKREFDLRASFASGQERQRRLSVSTDLRRPAHIDSNCNDELNGGSMTLRSRLTARRVVCSPLPQLNVRILTLSRKGRTWSWKEPHLRPRKHVSSAGPIAVRY
jgi:hypothetical protein